MLPYGKDPLRIEVRRVSRRRFLVKGKSGKTTALVEAPLASSRPTRLLGRGTRGKQEKVSGDRRWILQLVTSFASASPSSSDGPAGGRAAPSPGYASISVPVRQANGYARSFRYVSRLPVAGARAPQPPWVTDRYRSRRSRRERRGRGPRATPRRRNATTRDTPVRLGTIPPPRSAPVTARVRPPGGGSPGREP
jgi:hypothetical protein